MTLVGFLRDERFSVHSGTERLDGQEKITIRVALTFMVLSGLPKLRDPGTRRVLITGNQPEQVLPLPRSAHQLGVPLDERIEQLIFE